MLQRTVDLAVDNEVDGVVVTGDIVDEENEYFEAYGVFEREVTRLDDAGITTLVVSGNHDWDLVPDMVDGIGLDNVHLLGRGGTWDRYTLEAKDGDRVHLDGWSYPTKHVNQSPVDAYSLDTDTETPVIGVAHVDLDATASRYAPVRTAELRDAGADAWLLGHIHAPGARIERDPFVLYPGSPQGLDPGEPGVHGPWEVTVDTGSAAPVTASQRPLAKLRYESLPVDVSGVEQPRHLRSLISDRAGEYAEAKINDDTLEHLVLDVTLTGRTPIHSELRDYRDDVLSVEGLAAGVQMTVEGVSFDTQPDIDLEDLADGDGPAGYLAELLLSIRDGCVQETHPDLVNGATTSLETAYDASAYGELRREADDFTRPTENDAVEQLEQQAQLVLDRLVQQVEGDA